MASPNALQGQQNKNWGKLDEICICEIIGKIIKDRTRSLKLVDTHGAHQVAARKNHQRPHEVTETWAAKYEWVSRAAGKIIKDRTRSLKP